MKKILFFTLFILFSIKIFAQIEEKTSSFGLSSRYIYSKYEDRGENFRSHSPFGEIKVGHSIGDNLLLFSSLENDFEDVYKTNGIQPKSSQTNIGKFSISGKYLFSKKKRFVLFASFGGSNMKAKFAAIGGKEIVNFSNFSNTFSVGTGAYYFCNPNTAIEFRLNLAKQKFKNLLSFSDETHINLGFEVNSFFKNFDLGRKKEEKENYFLNKNRSSVSGYFDYFFVSRVLNNIENKFEMDMEYQKILSNHFFWGAKLQLHRNFGAFTPTIGFFKRVAPNFYLNPRIGVQAKGFTYTFWSNGRGGILAYGGLNAEYFLNQNISYRVSTSVTRRLQKDQALNLYSLGFSSGFNFYLK
jgi:hypothetical protein